MPTTTDPADPAPTIPYATPVPSVATRGWAAFGVLVGGLVLVGLAGCFLIGILRVLHPGFTFGNGSPPNDLTVAQQAFVGVLYACTAACLIGSAVLLFLGARALLRLARI